MREAWQSILPHPDPHARRLQLVPRAELVGIQLSVQPNWQGAGRCAVRLCVTAGGRHAAARHAAVAGTESSATAVSITSMTAGWRARKPPGGGSHLVTRY